MADKKPQIDQGRIRMLIDQIEALDAWHAGYEAGRTPPGAMRQWIPGRDCIANVRKFLNELKR